MARTRGMSYTRVKIYFGPDSVLQVVPDINHNKRLDAGVEFLLQALAHFKDLEEGVTIKKVRCKNNQSRVCGLMVYFVNDGTADEIALKYYTLKAKLYCEKHLLKFYGAVPIYPKNFFRLLTSRFALLLLIAGRKLGKRSEIYKRLERAYELFRKYVVTGYRNVDWDEVKRVLGLGFNERHLHESFKGKRKSFRLDII